MSDSPVVLLLLFFLLFLRLVVQMPHQKNTKEIALKKQLKAIQTKMYAYQVMMPVETSSVECRYTSAREHDILGAFKTYEEIMSNDEFVDAGLTKGVYTCSSCVPVLNVCLSARSYYC